MLPLLDASTADANPKFEALYNDICKNKLDTDGASVLDHDDSRQRKAFDTEMSRVRLDAARRDVIASALQGLTLRTPSPPDELRELIAIAIMGLGGTLSQDDSEAAGDVGSEMKSHIPTVAKALSTDICENMERLDRLLMAARTDSSMSTATAEDMIRSWRAAVGKSSLAVIDLRSRSTAVAQQIHETSQQIIEVCVRILEQNIHGSVSRSARTKADYLAIVSEGMSKKLELNYVQLLGSMDDQKARETLQLRNDEMSKQRRVLTRLLRDQSDVLDDLRRELGVDEKASEYLRLDQAVRAAERQIADSPSV